VAGCEVGTVFGNLDCESPTWTDSDRVNAAMIGDGAGALILRGFDPSIPDDQLSGVEILYTKMNCIGMGKEPGMYLPAGGCIHPICDRVLKEGLNVFKHDYRAVLEHGPQLFLRAMEDTFKDTKLNFADIDLYIPHQANGRVPDFAVKFGVPRDRLYFNFDRMGNTANGSLPICLAEIAKEDKLADGSLVMMVAAESTKWLYATVLFRWHPFKADPNRAVKRATQSKSQTLFVRLYSYLMFWGVVYFLKLRNFYLRLVRRR
jgi:3-oxoacyl-[acyl-carrier-protein] synthase-3